MSRLLSHLSFRYFSALAIAILIISTVGLVYKTASIPFRIHLDHNSKEWIYSKPEAEDKAVIMAKIHTENVDWVARSLQEWKQAIYYMDEPRKGKLHPPVNKGREAMAYLTFIIDHYDVLPRYMVFIHPHLRGWPEAWHTDSEDHNQIESVRFLRLEYLDEHGYANMRCLHGPGCPDEVQVDRPEDDEESDRDRYRAAEYAMREAWPYMFGGNYSDIPRVIAQPCCSQFAVSKTQVLKRSKADYEHYRQWLLDTPLDDATTGRVFEYLWHVIFGREPVHCPPVEQCWCAQFGRCNSRRPFPGIG